MEEHNEGGIIVHHPNVLYATVEVAGPYRFIAVISNKDRSGDYMELVAETPMDALRAIDDAKEFLAKRGYTVAQTHISQEVLAANLGGQISRYLELQHKAKKMRKQIQRRRRLPLVVKGAA